MFREPTVERQDSGGVTWSGRAALWTNPRSLLGRCTFSSFGPKRAHRLSRRSLSSRSSLSRSISVGAVALVGRLLVVVAPLMKYIKRGTGGHGSVFQSLPNISPRQLLDITITGGEFLKPFMMRGKIIETVVSSLSLQVCYYNLS